MSALKTSTVSTTGARSGRRRALPLVLALALSSVGLMACTPLPSTLTLVARAGTSTATTTNVARFVAGSTPLTDHTGAVWQPDSSVASGGSVWSSTATVVGAQDQALFRRERFNVTGYAVKVPSRATYRVTINEAELWWTRPGQRVFDVAAEGKVVAPRVDVVASAGAAQKAWSLVVDVPVTDGVLNLGFIPHVDLAKIDSLSVDLIQGTVQVPPVAPVSPTATPTSTPPAFSSGNPSPSPAPTTSAGATLVPVTQFGAVGDGVTDDTSALQRAFDAATPTTVAVLPAGMTFVHSGVLHLRVNGMHVAGPGVLLASNEQSSSTWIEADNVTLDGGVTLRVRPTKRWEAWEQMGLRLAGHTGTVVRNVTVDGSAAAGIYVGGTSNFLLDHITVQNSMADGVHMTQGANHGQVVAPTVINSGDDGVAIVSYAQDGTPDHDITVSSPRVLGTSWGRGISVVGGTDITYKNVYVKDSSAAAVYLASEGSPWNTFAPLRVTVNGGQLIGSNTNTAVDHGAVLILSANAAYHPDTVRVTGLTITDTRSTASRSVGVITYAAAPVNVVFDHLTLVRGPASAYSGNTPSGWSTIAWTVDGVAVPDHVS